MKKKGLALPWETIIIVGILVFFLFFFFIGPGKDLIKGGKGLTDTQSKVLKELDSVKWDELNPAQKEEYIKYADANEKIYESALARYTKGLQETDSASKKREFDAALAILKEFGKSSKPSDQLTAKVKELQAKINSSSQQSDSSSALLAA